MIEPLPPGLLVPSSARQHPLKQPCRLHAPVAATRRAPTFRMRPCCWRWAASWAFQTRSCRQHWGELSGAEQRWRGGRGVQPAPGRMQCSGLALDAMHACAACLHTAPCFTPSMSCSRDELRGQLLALLCRLKFPACPNHSMTPTVPLSHAALMSWTASCWQKCSRTMRWLSLSEGSC